MRLLIPLLFLIKQIHHGIDASCTSNEVGRPTGIGVGGATTIKIEKIHRCNSNLSHIGIGSDLGATPSHTTGHTDRVSGGSAG